MVDNSNVKPDTKKDVSLEYLKEKMRERAETEVPSSDSSHSLTEGSSSLTAKLDETKEAVEKVAEKLEELSEQVNEGHDHETTKPTSSKK